MRRRGGLGGGALMKEGIMEDYVGNLFHMIDSGL